MSHDTRLSFFIDHVDLTPQSSEVDVSRPASAVGTHRPHFLSGSPCSTCLPTGMWESSTDTVDTYTPSLLQYENFYVTFTVS